MKSNFGKQYYYLCLNNFTLCCNVYVYTEDVGDSTSLAKWSSLDLLTEEDLDATSPTVGIDKQGQFHVLYICYYKLIIFIFNRS